ncbi:MAG: thioredoxin-disulfide reductase [Candidatus Sumerlaeia bacterium]|nr:thioredoxin-disulfide reductase [Candidatus Sumerlaeia bacterium]
MSDTSIRNTVILGTGPAGLTAALYLGRANLAPLVFAGNLPGGQLTTTTEVENFPGFPEGVLGGKLMEDMDAQARKYGAEIEYELVERIEFDARPFTLHAGGKAYRAQTVIIATGASPRLLGVPGEQTYWNHGVHTCAVCDGGFYKGKDVVVVGGGDSAMEEASYLTKLANKVYVVHRRGELRASKIMADRALANPKIEFVWDSAVDEVLGEKAGNFNKANRVRVKNLKSGETREIAASAMFIAIGHVPNTKFLGGALATDEEGYLKVDHHQQTSIEGVFAAGDVHDRNFRQAITAAGMGCASALEAERYLTRMGLA